MAFHNETMLTNTGIYFKIIKSFTATAGIFGRYRVSVFTSKQFKKNVSRFIFSFSPLDLINTQSKTLKLRQFRLLMFS